MGAMLGFIPYNYPRASIFLGDSGSITHGFYLSLLGLLAGRPSVVEGHALTGTLAAIFVLMFFVFDTWFVALSRGKRKINFWWGGLDHTSHRLNNLGFSLAFVAILIWVFNAAFGVVALVIHQTAWWFAVPFSFLSFVAALRFWMWLNTIPIEEVDVTLLGAPAKKGD
jgi:UDP-GlcNAc:undecaprenyl-phosphate GlcNAc-1-phosphate transferase